MAPSHLAGALLPMVVFGAALVPAPASGWQHTVAGVIGTPFGGSTAEGLGVVIAANTVVAVGSNRFVVVALDDASGTEIWRYDLGDGVSAAASPTASGDVVAAGFTSEGPALSTRQFTVVRLSGATGMELWRREFDGTAPGAGGGTDVTLDAAGDVLVSGSLTDAGTAGDAVIVKLSAADGAEMWRYVLDGFGGDDVMAGVQVDPAGDVVARGTFVAPAQEVRYSTLLKLAGATGMEVWRREFADVYPGPGFNAGPGVGAIAVDGGGNVVAAGRTAQVDPSLVHNVVFALSGLDGTELWRRELGMGTSFLRHRLALRPSGDVIASDFQFGVAALAGDDGRQLWRQTLGAHPSDHLDELTVDAAGDVVAAGSVSRAFTIAKLSGPDGATVWRPSYGAEEPGAFQTNVLATTPGRDVVAAGRLDVNLAVHMPATRFKVLRFAGATGTLGACGDGHVDPGEECDEGTSSYGACCAAGCVTALPFECRTPTEPGAAVVRLTTRDAGRRALTWRWGSGAATSEADFGDPRKTTQYALCIFGGEGAAAPLLRAAASSDCSAGASCWRSTSRGFEYRNRSRSPDGLSRISLRAGRAGRARITVKGNGRNLDVPALPLSTPVTVQLRKTDGSPPCWSAEHDLVAKNRPRRFVARGE